MRGLRALAGSMLLALGLLTFVGCSDDPGGDDPGLTTPTSPPPVATTPDQFASLFRQAWEERDVALYDVLLADGFVFRLSAADVDVDVGGGVGFWDRASELRVALQMFEGADVEELDVESIQFRRWEVVQPWSDDTRVEEFAGAELVGVFDAELEVDFGEVRLIASGRQRLYLARASAEVEGEVVEVYVLRGWEDLGRSLTRLNRSDDRESWGAVKSLF